MSKDAEKVAIFGRAGSGKTTCVKQMTKDADRVIFFDPQREYGQRHKGWPGARVVNGPAALKLALKKARNSTAKMRLAYHPEFDQEQQALDALSQLLTVYQQPYFDGTSIKEIMLVVDEMNLSYGHDLAKGLTGFRRLVLQGRHYGVTIIGCTQMPTLIKPDFRFNSRSTFIFALADHNAINNVKQFLGPEHGEAVRNLKPHEALHYRDGVVEKHVNEQPWKKKTQNRP